jgi:hypothetical protein
MDPASNRPVVAGGVQSTRTLTGLLTLPPELRLDIYDLLFVPLVERAQGLDLAIHRCEEDWSLHTDVSVYLSLVLTCKLISEEASQHWRTNYTGECTFYFGDLSSLHRVATSLCGPGAPYNQAKWVLRSHWTSNDHLLRELLMKFMLRHSHPASDTEEWFDWLGDMSSSTFSAPRQAVGHGPYGGYISHDFVFESSNGYSARPTYASPDWTVWLHDWAMPERDERIIVMHGTIHTLRIGPSEYDPVDGRQTVMWFEEWKKTNFATAESERRQLCRRFQDAMLQDKMWLNVVERINPKSR